jgi:flagellar biosynthesis/type III secretory pathway M-ring protein FliF/YscJ
VSVSGESYIDKEYEQLIDEAVEISQPGVSYDQAVKKRRIESIVETKPDVVARQIKEWLNEN